MLGASVGDPLVRARTQKATLGSNDKIFRIRVERFCNEQLTYLWSVGVSSIDQVDTQFKGTAQDCDGFMFVGRWSPDARACQAHGTVAQTIHGQIAANGKCPAGCSRSLSFLLHCRFLLLPHSFYSAHKVYVVSAILSSIYVISSTVFMIENIFSLRKNS